MIVTDIWLYPPYANPNDIILSWGLRDTADFVPAPRPQEPWAPKLPPVLPPQPQPVVVAQSLHDDLVRRYGSVQGRRIYFEMEAQGLGPFSPGAKYDASTRPIPEGMPGPSHRRAPVINRVPPARRN
jgi:hypothetical protein